MICELCGRTTPYLFQLKDTDFPSIPKKEIKLCRRCFPRAVRYYARQKRRRDMKWGQYIPPETVTVTLPSWLVYAN